MDKVVSMTMEACFKWDKAGLGTNPWFAHLGENGTVHEQGNPISSLRKSGEIDERDRWLWSEKFNN